MGNKIWVLGITLMLASKEWNLGIPSVATVGAVLAVIGAILVCLGK